ARADARFVAAVTKVRGCTGDAGGSAESIAALVGRTCVAPVVTVGAEGRVAEICSLTAPESEDAGTEAACEPSPSASRSNFNGMPIPPHPFLRFTGGINPVTWQGQFSSDTPGVRIMWKWAAAVYTSFSTDYNTLGVKPVDDNAASVYQNADHAGTPEHFKEFVTGGARGGGGGNF